MTNAQKRKIIVDEILLNGYDYNSSSTQLLNLDEIADILLDKLGIKTKKYFRLFDFQTGRYMATGYNATSEVELIAAYISYISIDTDESELNAWKALTVESALSAIRWNEIDIESSDTPFQDFDDE